MDLDLRFTYVNSAIFHVTGYTEDEWIGTRLADHCDEENFRKMAQVASEEISKGTDSSRVIFEAEMLNETNKCSRLKCLERSYLERTDSR